MTQNDRLEYFIINNAKAIIDIITRYKMLDTNTEHRTQQYLDLLF